MRREMSKCDRCYDYIARMTCLGMLVRQATRLYGTHDWSCAVPRRQECDRCVNSATAWHTWLIMRRAVPRRQRDSAHLPRGRSHILTTTCTLTCLGMLVRVSAHRPRRWRSVLCHGKKLYHDPPLKMYLGLDVIGTGTLKLYIGLVVLGAVFTFYLWPF